MNMRQFMSELIDAKNAYQAQRQGDLLIIRLPDVPEGLQEKPRIDGQIVLAYGEVTGHKHAVNTPEIKWFGKVDDGSQVLVADRPWTLEHDEHSTLSFGAGVFMVIQQYEATADEIRPVFD